MQPAEPRIVTISGDPSSARFALCRAGEALERRLRGEADRIGLSGTSLTSSDATGNAPNSITDGELVTARPSARVLNLGSMRGV